MRTPGFTAEASLPKSSEQYLERMTRPATSRVVPQFCFQTEAGIICCECYFGYCYCHRPNVHYLV